MPTTKMSRMLGLASLAILTTILLLGLWPYQPLSPNGIASLREALRIPRRLFPANQVKWLENGPGLQFGDYGSIFSKTEFVSAGGKTGGSIELWAELSNQKAPTTMLAFSKNHIPIQFRLRQFGDEVLVDRYGADEKENGGTERAWGERGLHEKQRLLITVSFDESGTVLYLNGALARRFADFRIRAKDLEGTLVIGDSPEGNNTWKGIVRGLAIYDGGLSAEKAQEDFRNWQAGEMAPADDEPRMTALYLFREGSGEAVRSAVPGAPDLVIPKTYRSIRPAFLKPFWREYEARWEYWRDAAENVAAFIPLGLLLCAYLQEVSGKPRFGLTIFLGLVVSLTIEVLQYFLPFRNSGTTDLITNTLGTAVGARLVATRPVRSVLRWFEGQTRGGGQNFAN